MNTHEEPTPMTQRTSGPSPIDPSRRSSSSSSSEPKKFQPPIQRTERTELELRHKQTQSPEKKPSKKPPSPFDSQLHQLKTKKESLPSPPVGFSDLDEENQADLISKSICSSPSTTKGSRTSSPEEAEGLPLQPKAIGNASDNDKLPRAKDFWEGFDLPDAPPSPCHLQEKKTFSGPQKKLSQKKPASDKLSPELLMKQRELKERESLLETEKTTSSPRLKQPTPEKRSSTKTTPSVLPDQLPLTIQRTSASAYQAANSAHPLPEKIAELFQRMVGAIIVTGSAQTGIFRTEISLNFPAHSPFARTLITIERYSTAPDSFNIVLTGTPEAVRVFQSNLGTLAVAFADAYKDRRISFRIGRLETHITSTHTSPLDRKKQKREEDTGDFS